MAKLSPDEERQRGLTRDRLVGAALELVNEEGLDALSMRALADRLKVKAASLYWHVRDRRELLELVAESILDKVPATGGAGRGAGGGGGAPAAGAPGGAAPEPARVPPLGAAVGAPGRLLP